MNTTSTQTVVWHASGKDVNTPNTFILYVKLEADGSWKLGQTGDNVNGYGKSAWEAAQFRYNGSAVNPKAIFDLVVTVNLQQALDAFGIARSAGGWPSIDDHVRKALKKFGNKLHTHGKTKTSIAGIEELVGYTPARRDELIQELSQIFFKQQRSAKPLFQLYAYQRPVAQQLLTALLRRKIALMQCFGGYGKSATALDLAVRLYNGKGYCLILSPVGSTIQDFVTKAQEWKFSDAGLEVDIVELKSLTEAKFVKWIARCEAEGKVPVVIDTVQSARGSDATAEDFVQLDDIADEREREKQRKKIRDGLRKLDKSCSFLKSQPCFALLRDETHLHYAADQTSQVLSRLQPEYTLDMTATITARENATFKYEDDAVVTFGLLEALLAKRDGTDAKLAALPDIKLQVCTHLKLSVEAEAEIGAEANINGQKVFAFKHGKLLHPTTALEVIDMTFSLGVYGTGLKREWAACTLGRQITQTGVAMLIVPRGGKEGGAKEKIDTIVRLINKVRGDEAYAVSSYEFDHRLAIAGPTKTSVDVMEALREEAKGRKLIIVTHHKLLTGVNLPQLEGIALWDKIGSQALFMQTEYRLFRAYDDQLFGNGQKTSTKMVVYEPGVAIHDSSALQAMSAELRDGAARTGRPIKEIEHLVGLSVYTAAGLRDVTHDEMEAAYQAQLAAKQLELFGVASLSVIKQQLGEDIETVLKAASLGRGTNKGSGIDATGLSDDNGAKTTKPGQKQPAKMKEDEKQEAHNLLILCSMLEQLKLFSVHGAGGSMDSLEVASCSLVRDTWGKVNQELLLAALGCGGLKAWCDEHLRVKQLSFEEGGTLGPTKTEDGQTMWVLDNLTVMESLWVKVTKAPKTILVVNPKSGLAVMEARKRCPGAEIHALVMDDTFDLKEHGLTMNQVHHFVEDGTIGSMKFDLIIGNPPYLKGMHIKFLKLSFASLAKDGELVFIHPATPFIKQGQGVKDFDEETFKHLKYLQLMNPAIAFGGSAQLASPCSVTHVTEEEQPSVEVLIDGRSTTHTSLETISIHSGVPGYEQFKQRMLAQPQTLRDIAIYPDGGKYDTDCKWLVELSGLVGDFPRTPQGQKTVSDFFESCFFFAGKLMQVTPTENAKATGAKYAFAHDSREHAENCLGYLKTKFARAGLSIFKYNLHIYEAQLTTTPVVDFSRGWSDADLFEHFQLTEDERNFVRSMPATYDGYSEQLPASKWRNN